MSIISIGNIGKYFFSSFHKHSYLLVVLFISSFQDRSVIQLEID